ncbi:hypothetical protein NDU88_007856 [Pleurodeles waltl]|uniref:Uncharacterized protein n=1 Tax=Pleurodeles waltl TaxID=8319 RepID=A0AAV7RQM1_PLEWA|nr:hypothetical protein NDU88_007856 [Pleurodeles waltl]
MRGYGVDDRPQRTPAKMLCQPGASPHVVEHLDECQERQTTLAGFLQILVSLYARLYSDSMAPNKEDLLAYLDTIHLVWMDCAHCLYRDCPFTEEELQVIQALLGDKAPGLDSLTTSFYKEYAALLTPHLLAMYEDSLETRTLPPSLLEAFW